MRSLMNRIQLIEATINEEDGLTCEDVELCLSCMPKELADAVLKKLLEIAKEKRAAGEFNHLPIQMSIAAIIEPRLFAVMEPVQSVQKTASDTSFKTTFSPPLAG